MNCFWGNVFEYFKERRYAALFFSALMTLGGAVLVFTILYQIVRAHDLQDYLVYLLPAVVLFFCVWVVRGIARARARRRERYKLSPLSRDELSKARSKLLKR